VAKANQAILRLTYNDVIKHFDLQNPGSFGKPASQPDISLARRRIPEGWLCTSTKA
jgi:hypothetical protein